MEILSIDYELWKKKKKKKIILPLAGFEPATAKIKGKWSIHYTTNTALSLPIVHSIWTTVR